MTLLTRLRLAAIGGSWILALGTPALATPMAVGSPPRTGGLKDWPSSPSVEAPHPYGVQDGPLGASPSPIRAIGWGGRTLAPELSITLTTRFDTPPWYRPPGRQR